MTNEPLPPPPPPPPKKKIPILFMQVRSIRNTTITSLSDQKSTYFDKYFCIKNILRTSNLEG